MCHDHRIDLTIVLAFAATCAAGGPPQPVWEQLADFQDTWGPSQVGVGEFEGPVDAEVADDFNLVGAVHEVRVTGYQSGQSSNPLEGVAVRFYAFGPDAKPGALEAEYILGADDPNLTVLSPPNPHNFNVLLDPPFSATGKHFLSVQVQQDVVFGSKWYWDSANTGAPAGEALYMRNPGIGIEEWSHDSYIEGSFGSPPWVFATADADAAFRLFGEAIPGAAPLLASVGTPDGSGTVALADRIVLEGDSFGDVAGAVLIGGAPAAVSSWDNIRITAYPVDATPLGDQPVVVVTAAGESAPLFITITPREDPDGEGRVLWRFRADGLYIDSRPVVAADGTIYAVDIHGHLYSLEPDGGVRWIYRAAPPLCDQPLGLGADGTVYMGVLSSVIAVNADGAEVWRFQDPDFDGIVSGPTVGPDGNIYALTTDNNNGGLGAFSLTPAGELRWNTPGFFLPNGAPHGREMIFDAAGHVWTATPGIGPGIDSFYAFDMEDGEITFSRDGAFRQPAVSPDGQTIYGAIYDPFSPASLVAMTTEGDEVFSVLANMVTAGIDVGVDGNVYTGIGLDQVVSVDPTGGVRWTVDLPGSPFRYDPIVSPANQVVAVAAYTPMQPGFVAGLLPEDGGMIWQVALPFENEGFVWPLTSRMRFAPGGEAVYVPTTHNNYLDDPYCYLYAIDTGTLGASVLAGDLYTDGVIDSLDLNLVLASFGIDGDGDVTGDGDTDSGDLNVVLANFGEGGE